MNLPRRKSQRLKSFDYATEKYYFVTICTKDKQNLFCNIKNINDILKMEYSYIGEITLIHLRNIEKHFEGVKIDKYVIMPNHIHIIVVIGCNGTSERLLVYSSQAFHERLAIKFGKNLFMTILFATKMII